MSSDPATDRQKRYLKRLAERTGTTFSPPTSKADASRQIKVLQGRQVSTGAERRNDQQAVWARQGAHQGVHDSEIEGYGSSARWAR